MRHDMWFLDAVTALNQMRAAQSLGHQDIRAVAAGIGRPLAVASLGRSREKPTRRTSCGTFLPDRTSTWKGEGEILRIEARPANGEREITVDPDTGLITDEISRNCRSRTVSRVTASQPKQLAITFDDGPDPEWTPKILDVLKQEHATGNVFPDRHPGGQVSRDVTKRIYRRRPRDRQSHLHASRHQQHLAAFMRSRAEPDRALVRQPLGNAHGLVPPALLHRSGTRYRGPGASARDHAGDGLHHRRRQDRS